MADTFAPDLPYGKDEAALLDELAAVDTHRPLRGLVPSNRQAGLTTDPDFNVTSTRERTSVWQVVTSGLTDIFRAANPFSIAGPKFPLFFLGFIAVVTSWEGQAASLAGAEIQSDLGISLTKLASLSNAAQVVALLVAFPLGYLADSRRRVRILQARSVLSTFTTVGRALAPTGGAYFAATAASYSVGVDFDASAQFSLVGDWYPTRSRARVFGFLGAFGALGGIIGGIVSSELLQAVGWRKALLVFAITGVLLTVGSLLLREPVRGSMDRLELGEPVDQATVADPHTVSFAEGLRAGWSIRTLRLQAIAQFVEQLSIPAGLVFFVILRQKFGADTVFLGTLASITAFLGLPAALVGGALAQRLLELRPSSIMTVQAALVAANGLSLLGAAFAPNLPLFILFFLVPGLAKSAILPAVSVVTLQVAPARVRGIALQIGTPFAIAALALSPVLIHQSEKYSVQKTLIVFVPFFFVAGLLYLASAATVSKDINNARLAAAADDDRTAALLRGADPILVCRGVEAGYGDVQILYGIDLDVHTGETVALLGTNGSGKSTLLKTICGQLEASGGAVYYAGRDVTHAPTHESAAAGIVYMPGGQAVFPALTVRENLIAAARSYDGDPVADSVVRFPQLASRLDVVAGALSGGEQQQVALSQALLMKPKLLMIDELSLGLSPSVVESLLDLLRVLQTQGVTILLVEQSLNVAVTIADRALFMEKGSVSYDGPTAGLLARPDLIRAVFMGGAVGGARLTQRRVEESEADSVLKAEGITLSYGGVRALNDVSLVLQPGEVLGVIGSNGSGKSSLLDVLSGYTKPEAGQVLLDGVDVTELSPDARARAGLTRAFQNARLFGPLTVRETISLALERRTVKSAALAAIWAPNVRASERRIRERADGLMEILGLTLFSDKFIRELSTGTRRAVEVACMMAAEPKVLMLDEPSSGLAQAETEALGPALSRIVRETGCALLVIEHDLPLITSLSDRLLALELGTVLLTGTPTEVVNDPRVVSSYLSASEDVLARSGSRTTPTGKATS